MKKTLLASSIALTLSITAPSAQAAFTPLAAGNYTMNITGGCFSQSGNCQTNGSNALTDNTIDEGGTILNGLNIQAATYITEANTITTRTVGSIVGSGIANDGVMGVIDFSLDASGNISVSSFNQDTATFVGFNFAIDALGENGTSSMTGNINSSGAMSFIPTGREAIAAPFNSTIGVQEWSRDSLTGLYDTLTTGTSINRAKGLEAAFSLTGTALSDNAVGGWTGTLVSAGNINGSVWPGFNNARTSEVWDITITTAPAVPIPAAVWLFGSGLLGLIGVARRKHRHN